MPKFGEFFMGAPSKSFSSSQTPTTFNTLPKEAQDAFLNALSQGSALAENTSLFSPASLTQEQTNALSTLSSGINPTSSADFQSGIDTFSNPFENQVVQNAIRDINTTTQGQLSDIGTMASDAGGFGGTRQALLESEALSNQQKNVGDLSGLLRSQGFSQAADRTMNDIARSQNTATNLFGLGEISRGINTQQQQAPLEAVNYLMQLAQGFPTGGGGTSSGTSTGPLKGFIDTIGQFIGNVSGGAKAAAGGGGA